MKTKIFNLKNGAKVLFNKQTEVRGISVVLNFTAGAFNDEMGKRGVAHFCEHAIFGFPNGKMTREERASYRRKFEYFNAFTSNGRVSFDIKVTEEDFEDAIDFVTESFRSIQLTEEEFEKEKKIIEDEIKTRIEVNSFQYGLIERQEIINNEYFKKCDSGPAGSIESVRNITLQDLKYFIDNYLTLNNLIVSISGNISQSRVKKAMHKFVEPRIKSSTSQGFMARSVNELYSPEFHFRKSVEKGKALFVCMFDIRHIPWSYEVDRDWIISGILSPILQEYAYLFFRQKKNLCYGCSLRLSGLVNHLLNEFYIECQEENLQAVLDCFHEFVSTLPKDIPQEVFEKHKRKKVLSYNFDFLDLSKITDLLFDVYFSENKLFNDAYRKIVLKDRQSVSYQEVNDMYKKLFKTKPYVSIVSNDSKYEDFKYEEFCEKLKNT